MEVSYDVFLTCLPRDVNETVIRNLFKSVGNVSKVKIIDDKKNENYKLCFVGFGSMDEAMEGVRLADRSTAFGEPIKASISKKSLDSYDSQKPVTKTSNDFKKTNNFNDNGPVRSLSNAGRGRGFQSNRDSSTPSFSTKSVNLTVIKLKSKELIDVEIVDLSNLECICARPLKHTEISKSEIVEFLVQLNASTDNLITVDDPKVGDCYLGKWDDGAFYRAELLEVLSDGKFKVTFVDEGTSGDIVSEIKSIPEGPLQQYPKQFMKISLGCKNSDDLRNFIINESDGKKVSLYWLGEFNNGIPLINLFLGDEEIVEKFIQLNKVYIRDSFSLKFKDIPNHKSDTDCSSVKLIKSLYNSQNDFTVLIKDPAVIQCKKKFLSILPVPGDICIYEKRSGATVSYMRCVIRRRQLFSFDILLFDSGENLSGVSIDCLYAAEDGHKMAPPFTFICELDKSLGYSEATLQKMLSDDTRNFSIVSYKGNNRYLVSVSYVSQEAAHYPENILKNFVGLTDKVLVTHVVSPLNFYVQVDKAEYVDMLNSIHSKLNIDYNGAKITNPDSVQIGQAVVAPFSVDESCVGENFRAIVLEKRRASPDVHVFYIDYGNDGWVESSQLLDVVSDIASRPGLAINCSMNVEVKNNSAMELFSKLVGFTDNDVSELTIEVIAVKDGKQLLVDLACPTTGSVSASLIKSGSCVAVKDSIKSKPLCNGDSKQSVTHCEPSRPKPTDRSHTDIAAIKNEDYAYLLKKINDLEQRLAYLEEKDARI